MKIDGSGLNIPTNQFQIIGDLNLREGQTLIGKIISHSLDQALLEIAGRPLEAKVEGDLPPAGSTQMFQVKFDDQGRVILKVLTGNPESASGNTNASFSFPSKAALQNTIVAALTREGLVPTKENVETVYHSLQEFQAKYQLPVKPQIIAFVLAQKWPVTPQTILVSWVYQDRGLRDELWNTLKGFLEQEPGAEVLAKLIQNLQPDAAGIEEKIKSLLGNKLGDLLEKLAELCRSPKTEAPVLKGQNLPAGKFPAPGNGNVANQSTNSQQRQNPVENTGHPKDLNTGVSLQAMAQKPGLTGETKVSHSPVRIENANQEKIETVLEQNIALNKTILKNDAGTSPNTLVPLLIKDSRNMLHECLIKWKEEKNSRNDQVTDQILYMTIPTENMGDIKLALRTSGINTQINLKTGSEEIQKYLQQHLDELKESVGRQAVTVTFTSDLSGELSPEVTGVDLWM